jgi:DNA invertase Pin-like site-specific DNA recombinase
MPAGNATARAVAYYRKSNEDDGCSVEQQKEWAREACAREGVKIVREFTDQAKKGHETASRADFLEMLEFCRRQAGRGTPVDAIVCWHPNRFSRSDSQETSWFIWEFRKVGTNRIFTASHGWRDFRRMEDRILFNIEQDASNHQYVINLARDSTRGRIRAARKARYNGGSVPYGYRLALDAQGEKYYALGPDVEVEAVRWIFRAYADTEIGVRGIAEELTRRGVPTGTGRPYWGQSTVRGILSNPAYLGRTVWNRRRGGKFFAVAGDQVRPRERPTGRNAPQEWIGPAEGTHEPLVDPETFARCQEKAGRRKGGKGKRNPAFLLSGLVRCGHCGSAMIGRTNVFRRDGKELRYRRYYCCGYNRGGKVVCQVNGISADALARAVLRRLREGWLNPAALEALRAEIRRQDEQERGEGPARLEALRVRLQALERKVDQAAGRLLEEEDGALLPGLRQKMKELVQQRDALAADLDTLGKASARGGPAADAEAAVEAALAMMGRLDTATEADDAVALRAVLQEAVSFVELHFDHQPYGRRTRSVFSHGLVHRRTDRRLDSITGRASSVPRT